MFRSLNGASTAVKDAEWAPRGVNVPFKTQAVILDASTADAMHEIARPDWRSLRLVPQIVPLWCVLKASRTNIFSYLQQTSHGTVQFLDVSQNSPLKPVWQAHFRLVFVSAQEPLPLQFVGLHES